MQPLELFKSIGRSCLYAWRGVDFAFRTQRNFRIHLLAAGAVWVLALALRFSRIELVLLALTVGLVITAELLNTGMEFVLNLLESRNHPVVRAAKDVAAGGVLLAVFISVGVGILLFGPKLKLCLPHCLP